MSGLHRSSAAKSSRQVPALSPLPRCSRQQCWARFARWQGDVIQADVGAARLSPGPNAGFAWVGCDGALGGAELLVIDGRLIVGAVVLGELGRLRLHPGDALELHSGDAGATPHLKTGHLAALTT